MQPIEQGIDNTGTQHQRTVLYSIRLHNNMNGHEIVNILLCQLSNL